eukprot:TRINITY_DN1622_c0_g1_i1.p2 TRINITY_DN1622_c0_g1~~TRINITY_DN1622_c0_g1_i1.p2  ORF type:complete len:120 (+),score=14.70 TRINITY_DN1622_c0_g1_i1:1155-1514(+)
MLNSWCCTCRHLSQSGDPLNGEILEVANLEVACSPQCSTFKVHWHRGVCLTSNWGLLGSENSFVEAQRVRGTPQQGVVGNAWRVWRLLCVEDAATVGTLQEMTFCKATTLLYLVLSQSG